ncbi:unnamed protein product [Xylocopa violacea]|uniref:Uncharacterized protein n=1 Tax=Xylocopa violacea TaxID=135666 RepID=A0ABP1PBZ4_XYLVO
MSSRFISALLTTTVVCCALAEYNEFTATSASIKKRPDEDKLFANIVRGENSSKTSHPKNNDYAEGYEKSLDKQPRISYHRLESRDNSSCCGSRYGSNSSTRPDWYYNSNRVDSGRYPSKFGERFPTDRYGWQTQGQPPGSSGSTGRPGGGSFGGTAFYEGSQTGDRFDSRPSYGGESSHKPSGYGSGIPGGSDYGSSGYGGYSFNRPTGYGRPVPSGSYGISGTFANGDEFGSLEPNYSEGNPPPHPNIQTQKAAALKALAGVALIGAAAALAINPVLLPLGVVSGRRKRSSLAAENEDAYMDYILTILKSDIMKTYNNGDGNKLSFSPTCLARVTCEIQRNYLVNSRKNIDLSKGKPILNHHLINLYAIPSNAPNGELVTMRIKRLIKAGIIVASSGENCNSFTCTFVKVKRTKNPSILKL